jgi:DNA/RNA endonuclease G (NUC1)
MKRFIVILLFLTMLCSIDFGAPKSKVKPIIIAPAYHHDRYCTQPKDLVFSFRAYITSFDSGDDNNGDGTKDYWGIPEWVSYEIRKTPDPGPGPNRPNWMTDKLLNKLGIAPTDASYKYSKEFRKQHPNWYDRGHMCMKQLAWRMGENADWNTHTILNACPQKHDNNAGIWLDLEMKTGQWADKYGVVWIICGPIVNNLTPSSYIGEKEKKEMLVAVPDAFFKIVIRESDDINKPHVLAFIYPQDTKRGDTDHTKYLVSVDEIERKTNLDFFTLLPDDAEQEIESKKADSIWPLE